MIIFNMVTCNITECKRKATLIVGDCKKCSNSFCSHHRLPEDHLCSKFEEMKKELNERNKDSLFANSMQNKKMEII